MVAVGKNVGAFLVGIAAVAALDVAVVFAVVVVVVVVEVQGAVNEGQGRKILPASS